MNKGSALPTLDWTPERIASICKNILIVLVAGITLGIFAAIANIYYVALGIVTAILVILIAWQFEVTLLIYVVVAFIPWGETPSLAVGGSGVGKGVYVSEIMLGFLLMVWWGKYLLQALPKDRPKAGFYIPLILYVAYCVLNVVHSYLFWDPHVDKIYQHLQVNIIEIGLRVLSAGALVMMATSITNRKWLTWITAFSLVPGLYNLFNTAIGTRIPILGPWWSLIALWPVTYCWTVAIDPEKIRFRRAACAAVVAVAFYIIMIQGISWISGWIAMVAALAAVTFFKNKKLFATGAILAAVGVIGFWPFFQKNVIRSSIEEGDYDRFALFSGSIKYATHFPLGVGLGNYRTYNSFHYGDVWGTTTYTSAHGTYGQHLSETGFPGTILFLSILISGFLWMLRSYRNMRNGPSKTYLLAAMGQMVGIACAASIGDYIIPTYHNGGVVTFSATVYSWLIWGIAIAHVRISALEENGPVGFDSKLEYARPA